MHHLTPSKPSRAGLYKVRSHRMGITILSSGHLTREWISEQVAKLPLHLWNVVARETSPSTGMVHHHVYIEFKDRVTINSRMVEELLGLYCHLSYCTEWFIEYVIKEDPDHVVSGKDKDQVEAITQGLRNNFEDNNPKGASTIGLQVAGMIQQGHSVKEVAQAFPSYVLNNLGKIEMFKSTLDAQKNLDAMKEAIVPWEPLDLTQYLDSPHDLRLAKFLTFLAYVRAQRSAGRDIQVGRDNHIWIYGETNTGKSRFLDMVRKCFIAFDFHANKSNWQDDFDPDMPYEVLIFDEFPDDEEQLGMNLSQLILWLDGKTKVNRRNKRAAVRKQLIPAIFVCNKDPRQSFMLSNVDARAAMLTRFTGVELRNGQEIKVLSHLWDTNLINMANVLSPTAEFYVKDGPHKIVSIDPVHTDFTFKY